MRISMLVLPAVLFLAPGAARADSVADFYRGKQLQFFIRAAPGGNYDLYTRLLARHIVRHVPGNPSAVPVNMPGGGGLTALLHTENVAPHDGTAFTMITQTQPMDQALGIDKSKVDVRTMNWIGNMSDENLFIVTRKDSPTKTLDDARHRVTTLAATGAGGSESSLVPIANQVIGTKFKNVFGYRSSPEFNLAMERGEVDGRLTTNLRLLFASKPGGAANFHIIFQTGMKTDKEYPEVPLLREQGKTDNDRLVLDFISRVMSLARPVATNSNVPPERVEAMRRAFDATMKDPQFLAEANQLQFQISPWTGEELQETVREIIDSPPAVLDQIRKAIH